LENAASLDITVRELGAKTVMAAMSVPRIATTTKENEEGDQAGMEDGEKGLWVQEMRPSIRLTEVLLTPKWDQSS